MLGISPEEATFARRGFRPCEARVQHRLERIGQTFLQGYHAALRDETPSALARRLNHVDPEFRGFAFEGAGMALALLDYITPWRQNRLSRFLGGPGVGHAYMLHVGAGWTLARLPRSIDRFLSSLDPLLRWLAVDGYGFHEGYFRWRHYVHGFGQPERLSGYARRAFDQGLGRSLWFVEGADLSRLGALIRTFPEARRGDLWSGVGLACAYAGPADRAVLDEFRVTAATHLSQVAQGVAFAAQARQRAGNPASHTELASQVLCGIPAQDAAAVTDQALQSLPDDSAVPAYELWRRRIQVRFGLQEATA